jgi:hypothetical protein
MKHDNTIKLFISFTIIYLIYVLVTKESFENQSNGMKPLHVLNSIYPTCLPNYPLTSDEVVDHFQACAENSLVTCDMCNDIYKLVTRFPDNPELMDMYNACIIRNNCRTLEYRKWFNSKVN